MVNDVRIGPARRGAEASVVADGAAAAETVATGRPIAAELDSQGRDGLYVLVRGVGIRPLRAGEFQPQERCYRSYVAADGLRSRGAATTGFFSEPCRSNRSHLAVVTGANPCGTPRLLVMATSL